MAMTDLIIGAESGGDPFARNPRSSAGGSGQFIDSTWLSMISKYRPDIAQGKTREQLLQLKFDPNLSREMTEAYSKENQGYLKQRGIDPNPGNTYLAHFAGPAGAAAIHADPGATVEALLGPKAVAANPFLRGKSGQDVINWAAGKMDPSKMMAKSIRQRYGGGQSAPTAAPSAGAGMDRLKTLLGGKKYDADKLTKADELIANAQGIAKNNTNWLGALGATALAGYGGYVRDQEMAGKKAQGEELRQGLAGAQDPMQMARLLMASQDPQQQSAGIELFTKTAAAAKKAGEESFSKTPVWGVDANGNPALVQVSDRGKSVQTQLPEGVKIGKDPIKVDAGTHFILLDPVTRQPVGQVPKDVAGEAQQKKVGEGLGQGQTNLPGVEAAAERINRQITGVETDPNLSNVTGWESWLPTIGASNRATEEKVAQLGGSAFVQAFQDIKGGGAITEAEGQKATSALARLSLKQSDADFRQALADFKREVQALVELARTRAGQGAASGGAPSPASPGGGGARLRYNPETGELE